MPRLEKLRMSVTVMSNNVDLEYIKDANTKGAMLTMLAEVASQALLANDKNISSVGLQLKKKKIREITVEQALSLSTNHLLKLFACFESDEIKKSFSYKCCMLPKECKEKFASFGSESKARHMIKEHLHTHLYSLSPGDCLNIHNKDDIINKKLPSPTIKPPKKPKLKTAEEKYEATQELWNNITLSENESVKVQLTLAPVKFCLESEEKLPEIDHNYHRLCIPAAPLSPSPQQINTELPLIDGKEFTDNFSQDQVWNDMPEVAKEVIIKTEIKSEYCDDEDFLATYKPRTTCTKTIKSEDLPVLQDNRTLDITGALIDPEAIREYMHIERDEHRIHKKPKGKAKFIGQSAAEKEMAVRMIETMKLKQGVVEPLECQICIPPRVFTAPTTLISHYRSHAGIKPYECHLCGSVFTRQHSLNYHLLIHSNKTRFTCEDCGRKFRHPSHFKEHQRRHTGEAPFECSDCMSRFKTRNTYKRHLKTRHGKVLTQSGGIIILSDEEFRRVRTSPRSAQTRIIPPSNDKENNRRVTGKLANILRRKPRKCDSSEEININEKLNPPIHWNTESVMARDIDSSDTDEAVEDTDVTSELMPYMENISTTVMLVTTANFPSNVLNDSLNT